MKWLTIEYIKTHSRIDYDCEDGLLELYGGDAENTILHLIRRTLANVKDMNGGEVPPELYHAALLLTDTSYEHRNPQTQTNLNNVDWNFDAIVAPFIRHTIETDIEAERDYLLDMLTETESDLDFDYGEITEPTDEQTAAYESMKERMYGVQRQYGSILTPTDKICTTLRTKVNGIKEECKTIFSNADNG